MWPSTEASPAAIGAPIPPPAVRRCATITAIAPFTASSPIAITAIRTPLVRSTLEAPTLPLPTRRRSMPRRRDSRYANGTDPTRYASVTTVRTSINRCASPLPERCPLERGIDRAPGRQPALKQCNRVNHSGGVRRRREILQEFDTLQADRISDPRQRQMRTEGTGLSWNADRI